MKKSRLTIKHKAKPTRKPSSKRARSEKLAPATAAAVPAIVDEVSLLSDLRSLIHAARQRVAIVANSTQTMLYWSVGRRLLRENLQDGRATYGKRILATVSRELTTEFGSGFTYTSLTRMVRFAESLVDEQIVAALSQQLSWSHFMELLPIKDQLARDFYAEMCRIERWDVRTFRQKIGSMLANMRSSSRDVSWKKPPRQRRSRPAQPRRENVAREQRERGVTHELPAIPEVQRQRRRSQSSRHFPNAVRNARRAGIHSDHPTTVPATLEG